MRHNGWQIGFENYKSEGNVKLNYTKMELKTPRELMSMFSMAEEGQNYADVFNYIDLLHAKLKNYQMLIDHVTENNEHIVISPGALG